MNRYHMANKDKEKHKKHQKNCHLIKKVLMHMIIYSSIISREIFNTPSS